MPSECAAALPRRTGCVPWSPAGDTEAVNYEDIAQDFIERTLLNFQAAQRLRGGNDPFYEVTHLINSLLGLIVVPHEQMQDRLPTSTAAVMSQSAGTPSAIQLALRHPQRVSALVLMVPSAPGPGPMAPPKPIMRALFQTDFVIWVLAAFFRRVCLSACPRDLS